MALTVPGLAALIQGIEGVEIASCPYGLFWRCTGSEGAKLPAAVGEALHNINRYSRTNILVDFPEGSTMSTRNIRL